MNGKTYTADVKNGSYSVTTDALANGSYQVEVTAVKGDQKSIAKVTTAVVADEGTSVAGFILKDKVSESASGLAGATVKVGGKEVTTDANGYFQVSGLLENKLYKVEISAPGYETVEYETTVEVFNGKISSLVFEDYDEYKKSIENIKAESTVYDAKTGNPLSGATVTLQVFDKHSNTWMDVKNYSTEGATEEEGGDLDIGSFLIQNSELDPIAKDEDEDYGLLQYGGKYKLEVSANGYKDKTVDFTIAEDKVTTEIPAIELEPVENLDLEVVTSRDGNPTSGIQVDVVAKTGDVTHSGSTTNADGKVKFEDKKLETGKYFLRTLTPATATKESISEDEYKVGKVVKTDTVDVTEGKNASKEIALAQGTNILFDLKAPEGKEFKESSNIKAKIVDANGVVVAEKTATVSESNKDSVKFTDFNYVGQKTESDTSIALLPAGEYKVVVSGDYIVEKETTIKITATNVAAYVDEGTVLDEIGTTAELAGTIDNAANGETSITETGSSIFSSGTLASQNALAVVYDAKGNEVASKKVSEEDTLPKFTGLKAGDYTVKLYKPGYVFDEENSTFKVTVKENQDSHVGKNDLVLKVDEVVASIKGKVRKENLSPFGDKEASVSYYNADGKLVKAAETDENGDYAITNLQPGIYKVVVRSNALDRIDGVNNDAADDGQRFETYVTEITVKAGENQENINYTLKKGEVSQLQFSLVDENNKPYGDDSTVITLRDAYADHDVAVTLEAGAFANSYGENVETITFTSLSAGDYVIEINKDGFLPVTRAVKIEENDNYRLVYELSSDAYQYDVTGKVYGETATKAQPDALVVALDANGSVVQRVKTNATGDYTLKLTNGSYTVLAIIDGTIADTKAITVDRADVVVPALQLEGADETVTP